MEQKERPNNVDPTSSFKFQMQQKLQCQGCKASRVSMVSQSLVDVPVPVHKKASPAEGEPEFECVTLSECLDGLTSPEVVEFSCPRCQTKTAATKYV